MKLDELKQAGFTDPEIQGYVSSKSLMLKDAGFSDEEVSDYFGTFTEQDRSEFEAFVSPGTPESPGPEKRPLIREQVKVSRFLSQLPPALREEVIKRGIEKQREKEYGTISERPFSIGRMISNVPDNMEDIVNSVSSLIMNTGRFSWRFGKNLIADANAVFSGRLMDGEDHPGAVQQQFKPLSDMTKAIIYDWKALFSGEVPQELDKLPAGQTMNVLFEKVERQGLIKTIGNFIEEKPLDALIIGKVISEAAGEGLAATLNTVNRVVPKGTKISSAMDDILSTRRTPIVYELPAEVRKPLQAKPAGKAPPDLKPDNQITDYFMKDKNPASGLGEQQALVLTGGPAGGGKSTALKEIKATQSVQVNSDLIKEIFYPDSDATLVHESTSTAAKSLLNNALAGGYHTVYDSQLTNFPLADDAIQTVLQNKGIVKVIFTNIDAETSIVRSSVRKIAKETAREVPLDVSIKGGNNSLPTFIELYKKYKGNPDVEFYLYDNNVDFAKPVMVFTQESGLETVHNKKMFDKLMQTPYKKITSSTGEVRYEKTETVTRKDLDAATIDTRRARLLDKKGIRELPDPGRGAQTEKISVKTLEFPREYSKDPLTKYIYQKSFDAILDIFPGLKAKLGELKAKKLLNTLRNLYEDATFKERTAIQAEILEKISALSDEERAIIVPYLEGRAMLVNEPSEQFAAFEAWYRDLVSSMQDQLIEKGSLTPAAARERAYQPLAKATGLTTDEVAAELGDFVPVYVHHTFPKRFADKMSIFFAETTGKRYTPGFLKKSKGVAGYSEKLEEILPKWTAEYVKFKNTEAFLAEFTEKFGIRVNIKDVIAVDAGLQVGDRVYRGYRIVAPDGYLSFYRGKIDFYKEVSRRLENSTFDEAIGSALADILQNMEKTYTGVSRNRIVYLVPEAMTKQLESFATPFMGSEKAQNIVRLVVDKPTQVWKDSVLSLTPRWIKNNVMGDIIFNTFEGVGPMSYSRAFTSLYKDIIPDELLAASFANVMKYNPQLGNTVKTTIGGLINDLYKSKVVSGIAKAKDTGYALNTMFEQPFVRALYISLARKKAIELLKAEGLPASQVNIMNKLRVIKATPELSAPLIEKVYGTLPVFNLTGSFERKYLRRFIPFYNWYKFMARYAIKLPVSHPFLLAGARGLGALSEEDREEAFKQAFPFMAREIEESGIPHRFAHLWPVGGEDAEGKAVFFNARGFNVFTTIEDFTNFGIINMFSPVIKVPMERATGREAFTGREFTLDKEGVEYRDFEKGAPPLIKHILSQFPQYTLLQQILVPARQFDSGTLLNPDPILDPITGEYKYPIESLEKALNYAGIDRKTLDIREVWDAYKNRKRTELGKRFDKARAKVETALSFEEIRQIFNEIRSDEQLWQAIQAEVKDSAEQKMDQQKDLREKIREQDEEQ